MTTHLLEVVPDALGGYHALCNARQSPKHYRDPAPVMDFTCRKCFKEYRRRERLAAKEREREKYSGGNVIDLMEALKESLRKHAAASSKEGSDD